MSLVSHLVGIIEHQGTLDEQCEKCSQAIAVAQAEDALTYPGAPNIGLSTRATDDPVLPGPDPEPPKPRPVKPG